MCIGNFPNKNFHLEKRRKNLKPSPGKHCESGAVSLLLYYILTVIFSYYILTVWLSALEKLSLNEYLQNAMHSKILVSMYTRLTGTRDDSTKI